jgi:hypothetical protein
VAAAEREEIIQSDLVGQVRGRQLHRDFPAGLAVEQIVGAERQIENVAGLHATRIQIVIGTCSRWQRQQCGGNPAAAAPDRIRGGRRNSLAGQA